jgi:hypothetical protein
MDGVFPMMVIDQNKLQKTLQTRLAGKTELLTSVVSTVLMNRRELKCAAKTSLNSRSDRW